ncbi:hypothetical protein Ancab_012076, partial [Ancistrocladus abbreviatus]
MEIHCRRRLVRRKSVLARRRRIPDRSAEYEEICNDKLAGQDRDGGRRVGEESVGDADQALRVPAEASSRFPATAESPFDDVQSGGSLRPAVGWIEFSFFSVYSFVSITILFGLDLLESDRVVE